MFSLRGDSDLGDDLIGTEGGALQLRAISYCVALVTKSCSG